MQENIGTRVEVTIEEELKNSFLDYAMSVIIARALPDVRDGLKPVHRRILYAMYREGILPNKKYTKCAGVVGEVLKKYHPHGDTAVYDTLVRMAQPWNLRYPLIDGQGNFGSIDGDSAAAYRYTECKLDKIALELLNDIDKDTVGFTPNYDGTVVEPVVIPSLLPNLLVNGSAGIAVGMATNIPPHNLKEVVDALVLLIDKPEAKLEDIMRRLPGPDFPTGGFIPGREGIREAYETGKGIIQMRARILVEQNPRTKKTALVVTEIPYQITKTRIIEKIAEMVNQKKLEGISDLRDESDREGMRIVMELKRDANPAVVRNQLYKHTPLQDSFGIIMLAIVDGRPEVLTIRQMLDLFIKHRKEVVTRRTMYELRQAEDREHLLLGFKKALDQLDEVIKLIRASKTPPEAKEGLIKKFEFSDRQAQAILEMRLQRLTGMERQKILDELKEVQAEIERLKDLLASEEKIMALIKKELVDLRDKYGDERRTEIVGQAEEINLEDLIAEEDMVVTMSHRGYIKRNPVSLYRAQRRGGKGKTGMTAQEEDFIENLFVASTHAHILFFTNKGKVYAKKVHEIPQAGRAAKGKAIINVLPFDQNEQLRAILPVREFEQGKFIITATRKGLVKKSDLMAYSNIRATGIIGVLIEEGDDLIDADLTDGNQEIFLGARQGKSVRFKEAEVRPMGRGTRGVKGMGLAEGDEVVKMETLSPESNASLITVTENGYGKRTAIDEYPVHHRGGSGVITIKTTERNGAVQAAYQVTDDDQLMIITDRGKIIRMNVAGISVIGRNTQGVRLIHMEPGEKVTGVCRLMEREEENGEGENGEGEGPEPSETPEAPTGEAEPESSAEPGEGGEE
ncbi:MAG TPA: DNA gyrase subunit A [bacterium]|nr:DNA gyrase subunit A [bacterium]